MTQDEFTRLAILGMVNELPIEDQRKCFDIAQQMRNLIASGGICGLLALALVGIEKQIEQSRRDDANAGN